MKSQNFQHVLKQLPGGWSCAGVSVVSPKAAANWVFSHRSRNYLCSIAPYGPDAAFVHPCVAAEAPLLQYFTEFVYLYK